MIDIDWEALGKAVPVVGYLLAGVGAMSGFIWRAENTRKRVSKIEEHLATQDNVLTDIKTELAKQGQKIDMIYDVTVQRGKS
ncbi:MAG: hypothetical protein AAGP08_15220 [Pseudomonadota bacterium]